MRIWPGWHSTPVGMGLVLQPLYKNETFPSLIQVRPGLIVLFVRQIDQASSESLVPPPGEKE